LHDVSHSAFSHVVDCVYGSEETESYQDNFHEEFIKNSSISKILEKYKYDPKKISNLYGFKLLDRDIPEMCVDRFEYTLRELSKDRALNYLEHIYADDNHLVFDDVDVARDFAKDFLKKQTNHWGGFEAVIRYRLFADVLKKIIGIGLLKHSNFWDKTENEIVEIMKKSGDSKVGKILDLLKNNKKLDFLRSNKGIKSGKKFRYVDPLIKEGDNLIHLSKIDDKFAERIYIERENNKKGIVFNVDNVL